MFGRLLAIVGIAVLAVVCALIANVLHSANVFVDFPPHDDEQCTLLTATPNAAGLEDGDIANGVVLFTADGLARRLVLFAERDGNSKAQLSTAPSGALFAYVDGELRETKRIREPESYTFHPHGMSLLGVKSGAATNRARLFVVNHRPDFEEVSVYNYDADSNTAEYIDAIRDRSLLRNINDVTAVSESEVYITIWHYAETNSFANTIELFTQRPWTYVVRCAKHQDVGWQCRVATDGLVGANGVNHSRKKDWIFVSECTGRQLAVYARNLAGALTLRHKLDAPAMIDNIFVGDDSRIFVTAATHALKFLANVDDPSAASPTVVYELVGPLTGGTHLLSWKERLVTGKLNSGSIALVVNSTLLVGGVFQEGLLKCPFQK